jgi:ribosome-binding factor A
MARKETKPLTPRQLKVGEELRRIIAESLSMDKVYLNGFNTAEAVISEVRVSPDFSSAKVFVSPLRADGNMQELIDNMYLLKGQLKKILGGKIHLRLTPELIFLPDESFAEADRIETLLSLPDVKRDLS